MFNIILCFNIYDKSCWLIQLYSLYALENYVMLIKVVNNIYSRPYSLQNVGIPQITIQLADKSVMFMIFDV